MGQTLLKETAEIQMVKNLTNFKKKPILLFFLVTLALFFLLTLLTRFNIISPQTVPLIPTVSTIPSVGNSVSPNKAPAKILNLSNWKLTLPIGPAKDAVEIKQPQLANFQEVPLYYSSSDGIAVIFRAPVNGATTENSEYPRSELREMTGNGQTEANWNTSSGIHTMTVEEAILAVPKTKKQLVSAQIHDADDDVIVIRLDYPKLYVNVNGENKKVLDPSYQLGKRFTVKFEVEGDKTHVYYNGSLTPSYTLSEAYLGAYFKAGAYTQSNCTKEAVTACNQDNFGEVAIYKIEAFHK